MPANPNKSSPLRILVNPWAQEGHESKGAAGRAAAALIIDGIANRVKIAPIEEADDSIWLRLPLSFDDAETLKKAADKAGMDSSAFAAATLEGKRGDVEQRRRDEVLAQEEQAAQEATRAAQEAELAVEVERVAQTLLTGPRPVTVTVKRDDGRIFVWFSYDAEAVAAMKTIPGAKWDQQKLCWNVAEKFQKQLDGIMPQLNLAKARADARTICEFESDPPPATQGVNFSVHGRMLAVKHRFTQESLQIYNRLKAKNIATYDGKCWLVRWSKRHELYRELPAIESAIQTANDGYGNGGRRFKR
jgi:hypothetical protein